MLTTITITSHSAHLNDPDGVKEGQPSLGSEGREKCEHCGDQHACTWILSLCQCSYHGTLTHSKQPFASKKLGESSSRQLSEDIAIEEHAQDDTLTRITLRSRAMTNKKSHGHYQPIRGKYCHCRPMRGLPAACRSNRSRPTCRQ